MDRNYCFRRKRHSYAACDAALAASIYIILLLLLLDHANFLDQFHVIDRWLS